MLANHIFHLISGDFLVHQRHQNAFGYVASRLILQIFSLGESVFTLQRSSGNINFVHVTRPCSSQKEQFKIAQIAGRRVAQKAIMKHDYRQGGTAPRNDGTVQG